ncbi:hypothetical protein R1sor_025781 [Riccia sorocarpa]|uniref:Uncharacterized protein n=1 Tax=Riccia sorocarpa TaxID=122646 RepID=A0ABD3GA37_9MARC
MSVAISSEGGAAEKKDSPRLSGRIFGTIPIAVSGSGPSQLHVMRIPDSVPQNENFYRSAEVFELLSGLFTGSKLWKCGHASHGSPVAGSSEPASVVGSSTAGVVVSEASLASESTSASGVGEDSDDECH